MCTRKALSKISVPDSEKKQLANKLRPYKHHRFGKYVLNKV